MVVFESFPTKKWKKKTATNQGYLWQALDSFEYWIPKDSLSSPQFLVKRNQIWWQPCDFLVCPFGPSETQSCGDHFRNQPTRSPIIVKSDHSWYPRQSCKATITNENNARKRRKKNKTQMVKDMIALAVVGKSPFF